MIFELCKHQVESSIKKGCLKRIRLLARSIDNKENGNYRGIKSD